MNPNMTTTGKEILYMDNAVPLFEYKTIDITMPRQNPLYKTLQQIYDTVSNMIVHGTFFA